MWQVSPVTYQALLKANERYQLIVMGVFVAAFFVALAMMLVHPTVALLLFWLGLISLGLFSISEKLIGWVLRDSAKRALARYVCPCCGAGVHRDPSEVEHWCCDRCGAAFMSTGRRDD